LTYKGWRVGIVIIAAVISLGLLSVGHHLAVVYLFDAPLDKFLATAPGVEEYAVDQTDDGPVVTVNLGRVDDLRQTYGELLEGVRRISSRPEAKVVIRDTRTPELREEYYRLHYTLQEGLATGRYAWMAQAVAETMSDSPAVDSYRLYVDSGRVYLQLHRGDRDLYVILEEKPDEGAGRTWGGEAP